jgi:glycosyltransferase involved in cell wall biosynthesis
MSSADPTKYHFMMMNLSRSRHRKTFYACNSLPSKKELMAIWPEVPEDSIEVIPCAVSGYVSPLASSLSVPDIVRLRLSEMLLAGEQRRLELLEKLRGSIPDNFPYILGVAALEPKKNIPGIIRAFEQARLKIPGLKLILVGNSGWRSETLHTLLRAHFMQGLLYHLEGLPHPELQALYRQAHCLVYPSIAEGFGLPPVEALVCGTPTVCGDIASLRWVMEGAAVFADPYDASKIASGIIALTNAEFRRRTLAGRNNTLLRFAPETVALQWQSFFERILSEAASTAPAMLKPSQFMQSGPRPAA